MKHLDLFSGIGGFALAARWAAIETVGFSEIDPFCCKVLAKNFPNIKNYGNIKNMVMSPQDVDIVTGGFPCQPFSVAGSKKGVKDDRYLWPEFKRIIKECRPNFVIIENVPGIISHVDTILEDLEKENYTYWPLLIPASFVGAPHKRERLWIVAYSNSIRRNVRQRVGQERHIQSNIERHIETIQSEWLRFIPQSWSTFNAQNWLESAADTDSFRRNEGTENQKAVTERSKRQKPVGTTMVYSTDQNWQENKPPISGVDDGLPNLVDRNRALGNAIVPQVIYPIMEFIKMVEVVGIEPT